MTLDSNEKSVVQQTLDHIQKSDCVCFLLVGKLKCLDSVIVSLYQHNIDAAILHNFGNYIHYTEQETNWRDSLKYLATKKRIIATTQSWDCIKALHFVMSNGDPDLKFEVIRISTKKDLWYMTSITAEGVATALQNQIEIR